MMEVKKTLSAMPLKERELYVQAIKKTCALNHEIFEAAVEGKDSLLFQAIGVHRETVTFLKKYLESQHMNYVAEVVYIADGGFVHVHCTIRVEWGDGQSELRKAMGVE